MNPSSHSSEFSVVYDHPMEWILDYDRESGLIDIKKPDGDHIYIRMMSDSCSGEHVNVLPHEKGVSAEFVDTKNNKVRSGNGSFVRIHTREGLSLLFSLEGKHPVSLRSNDYGELSRGEYESLLKITRSPITGSITRMESVAEGIIEINKEFSSVKVKHYVAEGKARSVNYNEPFRSWDVSFSKAGEESTMRVVTTQKEKTPVYYEKRESGDITVIITGEGEERILETTVFEHPSNDIRIYTTTIQRVTETQPSYSNRRTYQLVRGQWVIITRVEGYNTDVEQTTEYVYEDGYFIRVIYPDGGYARYEYDNKDRVILWGSPWVGGGESLIEQTYQSDSDDNPATIVRSIIDPQGIKTILSNECYLYEEVEDYIRKTRITEAIGSSVTQTYIEEKYTDNALNAFARGRNRMIRQINGVELHCSYEGTNLYGASRKETVEQRVNNSPVPGKSIKEVYYVGGSNDLIYCFEQYAHDGQNWVLANKEEYEYDALGRVVQTTKANGRISSNEWMCCGLLNETDEDGISLYYSYDSARLLIETTRSATETTPETITSYVKDSYDRILSTRVDKGAMSSLISTVYDGLGRVTQAVDELGRITSYSYAEQGRLVTLTTPSGATLITRLHQDGSLLMTGGTARVETVYIYEATPSGIRITDYIREGNGFIPVKRETRNGFEQVILLETPRANRPVVNGRNTALNDDDWIVTVQEYNDKGLLKFKLVTSLAPELYEYDALGMPAKKIIKLSDTPTVLNSRISLYDESFEVREGLVYKRETRTRYNAQGMPLSSVRSALVSLLNPDLEAEVIEINERGVQTVTRQEYGEPAKRLIQERDSRITGIFQSLVIDGFMVERKYGDQLRSSYGRSFRENGMTLTESTGRNTISTEYNLKDQVVKMTQGQDRITLFAYDLASGLPSAITDAMGNTHCYSYDIRSRKIAEYGTGMYPVSLFYDESNRLTELRTFRSPDAIITTDPSSRTDYSRTQWIYDPATGLETGKVYHDGSSDLKAYDDLNRVSGETKASGKMLSYGYAALTGEMVSKQGTSVNIAWQYNYLGQVTHIQQGEIEYSFTYTAYGEVETETKSLGKPHVLTRKYDQYGRKAGYKLHYLGETGILQETTVSHNEEGLISRVEISRNEGIPRAISYDYLSQEWLPEKLIFPNGLTRLIEYEQDRDLPCRISSIREAASPNAETLVDREQSSNKLGRAVERTLQRQSSLPVLNTFTYNGRRELHQHISGSENDAYFYDNIGNRTKRVCQDEINYSTNGLNQYIQAGDFIPEYDADGNQTRLSTPRGIWNVDYNEEGRPIRFSQGAREITCEYDYRGRRIRKTTRNLGVLEKGLEFSYDDYTQIATFESVNTSEPQPWELKHTYVWDPSQTEATTPLAFSDEGELYYYGSDFNKNITELYNGAGALISTYDYSAYGELISHSQSPVGNRNPYRFSSEYYDEDLGLVYYNFRHYNPADGRWISRDPIGERGGDNLYAMVYNDPVSVSDLLGKMILPNYTNCLGFALTGQSLIAVQPDKNQSMEDYVKKYTESCKKVETIIDCSYKKPCVSILIVFRTIKTYKGDPWKDPQEWGGLSVNDPNLVDFHGVRNDGRGWKEIQEKRPIFSKPRDVDMSKNSICMDTDFKKYCCCQDRKKQYPSMS